MVDYEFNGGAKKIINIDGVNTNEWDKNPFIIEGKIIYMPNGKRAMLYHTTKKTLPVGTYIKENAKYEIKEPENWEKEDIKIFNHLYKKYKGYVRAAKNTKMSRAEILKEMGESTKEPEAPEAPEAP